MIIYNIYAGKVINTYPVVWGDIKTVRQISFKAWVYAFGLNPEGVRLKGWIVYGYRRRNFDIKLTNIKGFKK